MVSKATPRQLQAVGLLMKGGLSSSGAIACVANFSWEGGSANLNSGFRTGKLDHGSQGLPQWRLGRLDGYMLFVAQKHPDLERDYTPQGDLWPWFGNLSNQCEYVILELQRDYKALHDKLAKGGDIASLVAAVCWQYERPNRALAHLADRVAYGKAIAAGLIGTKLPTDISTHITAQAHEQDTNQAVSGGLAAVPLVGGSAVAAYHWSGSLQWFEWIALAIGVVIFVLGVIGFIQAHIAATNLKTSAASITPAVPRGGEVDPIKPQVKTRTVPKPSAAKPAPTSADTKQMHPKGNAEAAAQADKTTLAKAMTPEASVEAQLK